MRLIQSQYHGKQHLCTNLAWNTIHLNMAVRTLDVNIPLLPHLCNAVRNALVILSCGLRPLSSLRYH